MATVVQSTQHQFATGLVTAGVVTALSLPGAATVGNDIIVCYMSFNDVRTVASIADDGSTSYSNAVSPNQGGPGTVHWLWGRATSTSAGANVILTLSGNHADEVAVWVAEVSSLASDQTGRTTNEADTAATTTHDSGAVTPANASGITVAAMTRTSGTWTEDGGFTESGITSDFVFLGYVLNSGASTELNVTSADPDSSTMQIVAFVGVGGGTPYALAWIRA